MTLSLDLQALLSKCESLQEYSARLREHMDEHVELRKAIYAANSQVIRMNRRITNLQRRCGADIISTEGR